MQQHITTCETRKHLMIPIKAKKLLIAILAILILLPPTPTAAQNPTVFPASKETLTNVPQASVDWEKIYGGAADDRAFYTLPVEDGFLIVGSTKSAVANVTVGWALMLDSEGNEVWNRTYYEGTAVEFRCAISLADDGFLLIGNEFPDAADTNGYIAKIDCQGVMQWKTAVSHGGVDKLFSAIPTQDGFVAFGLAGNEKSDAWVVKFGAKGGVVWEKTFSQSVATAARSGVLAPDGSYMAAGYAATGSGGNCDFYLLKIGADGSLLWNKTYGGVESEKAYSMTKTPDGYLIVGDISSSDSAIDALMIKVDFDGNMVWSKAVGGQAHDSPSYVTQALDGGYLVAGFTFSFGNGERDFWLFKIGDEGQVVFSCTLGDEAFQEAYSIVPKSNNQFVMVGWTDPAGKPELIGKATYDFYIAQISVAPTNGGVSFITIAFTAIGFAVLAVSLLLLYRFRAKRK